VTPAGTAARLPLDGLKVIDLTQVVSGAVTTMLLADFGADVIKIEPPSGEPYRRAGYTVTTDSGAINLNILRFSRGKRSVVIDLKSEVGRDVLKRMLEDADVLVENFRPGVLARMGLSAEELATTYPNLVYTSVSGFGHGDVAGTAAAESPAFAITVEALAGLTHLAGAAADAPPVWMGFAMADIFAGVLAFAGTLVALRQQEVHGPRVDVSMFDGAVFMNDLALLLDAATGTAPGRGGYALQAPWGPYPTRDGYVVIAVLTDKQWRDLCDVIDRGDLADDPTLRTGLERSRTGHHAVDPAITAWTSDRTRAEASHALNAAGVPAAGVNTARDVSASPLVEARRMLVDVDDPASTRLRVVGNPIKVKGHRDHALRVPDLGEHTTEVLREHGFAPEELGQLPGRRTG
jgi:CoA:oxalate CoA-transferase